MHYAHAIFILVTIGIFKVLSNGYSETSNFFRDCKQPTLEPTDGRLINGAIPQWLEGTLLRNGAGIQTVGSSRFNHFFDGLAILHRFHIQNGKVTYNNRPLESDAYKADMSAGRVVRHEWGTAPVPDPCESLFSKFKSVFVPPQFSDNCNVNVVHYGDQLYAMTETVNNRRINGETLETLGEKTALDKYFRIDMSSAHPHVLADGTVITMGTAIRHIRGAHYVIFKVPPSYNSGVPAFSAAKIVAEIKPRWKFFPSYSHSFSIASDKVVFVEQPLCFNYLRFMMIIFRLATFGSSFQWWPGYTTRIHVVSTKDGGKVSQYIYETKDLFIFHQVNAYEEDGQVVLDVSGYDSGELVTTALGPDTMGTNTDFQNSLRRYVLPLDIPMGATSGENFVTRGSTKATASLRPGTNNVIDLEPEILYPFFFEFPRINYKYNGKKYRFAYGATSSNGENELISIPEPNQISKYDLESRSMKTWFAGENVMVSEPVFITRQPEPLFYADEDGGVLLVSLLHKSDDRKVSLVILNATSMAMMAEVEFRAEGTVPSTLHGQWAQFGAKVNHY